MEPPSSSRNSGSSGRPRINVTKALYSIPSDPSVNISLDEEKKREENRKRLTQKARNSLKEELATSKPIVNVDAKFVTKGPITNKLKTSLADAQFSCQFNHDASKFVCGGTDGKIRVFDAEDASLKVEMSAISPKDLTTASVCVTAIQHWPSKFASSENIQSADGCITCSHVNGLIKAYNYNLKKCLFTIKEGRQTYGLLHHPKLPKFITYGDDMKINMYDVQAQVKERIFEKSSNNEIHDGPTSRVFGACFNPVNNSEFITGGWDDTVLQWDLRTPNAVRYFSGVHLCGDGLDIDKSGRNVLTCSWTNEDALQLWDYRTFKILETLYPDNEPSRLYCGKFYQKTFVVCGGGDPPIFRIVELLKSKKKTKASVTNLMDNVYSLSFGKLRTLTQSEAKKDQLGQTDEFIKIPTIIYTCGSRVYEVTN